MSEHEETDSLTLATPEEEAVARAIAHAYSGDPNYDWTCFVEEARAAIKAYELHQALTNRDLP